MGDWSVRNANSGVQQIADALLRTTGGYVATFMLPPVQGDMTDAAQLGLNPPNFQPLLIAPVVFRRTRPVMQEGKSARYELLVSGAAIAQEVSLLQLSSVESLLSLVASVTVSGLSFVIEEWSCSVSLGEAILYRLLLRPNETQSIVDKV